MLSVKQLLLLQKYDVFADEKQLETESNSTVDSNRDFTAFVDSEKTKALYRQVITRRCVTINGKLLTLDDVCAVINRTVITVMLSVKHNDVSASVTDCDIQYERILSFYYSVPLRACS